MNQEESVQQILERTRYAAIEAVHELAAPPVWPRAFEWLLRLAAEARRACGAFEWIALGYLSLLNLLISLLPDRLPHAPRYIALHVSISSAIIALCFATQRAGTNSGGARKPWAGALRFARHWYPQTFFLFCFEELGRLVHLVFPGWFDSWLVAFDHALTGVQPSIWLVQFANPALTDFLQMAYTSYFLYLIVIGVSLERRGEMRAFWTVMTGSAAAYVMGYVISIFFPIESPHFALAALRHGELRGGPFTWLIGAIEHYGRVHGAAFPSAHVSGSTVAILGAWRYRRRLFWTLLPLYVAMLFSTVYGSYHYVADVLAGLAAGAIGFQLGSKLMGCRNSAPHAWPEEPES